MSIKAKLSLSISGIVAVILTLNIILNHIAFTSAQEEALKQQTQTISKHITTAVQLVETTRASFDTELAEHLRVAAIMVKERLGADIEQISNEQLVSLSADLGLSDITLWERIDGNITSTRSSNPKELNLNPSTWDYWNTAFHQLFDDHEVTIPNGQKLPNYWSGPMNFAVSNPSLINKWGYYYDGSTNYMINTMVNVGTRFHFDYMNATNSIIAEMIEQEPSLLEISGLNPQFFGKQKIIKMKGGEPVYNLDVREISFGQYKFQNVSDDSAYMHEALSTGEIVTSKAVINDLSVIRIFIPVDAEEPYVIGLAFNETVLKQPIRRQLIEHIVVSLSLVLLTLAASYFIAGYMTRPLNQIFHKVHAISSGDFSTVAPVHSKDELGLLASRIDSMGNNLSIYMSRLKQTASELLSTKQYLESFFSQTSDAIHAVDLDGSITQVNKAFEAMFGWKEAEVLGQPLPIVPVDRLQEHKGIIRKVMKGQSVTDYETVAYTREGQLIDVSITVSAIRDELGQIVAIASITRNITSRKQTEEMIRRTEKLSVVGQLAAGVAHEVRNPLTTLRGFVQLHKKTGSLPEPYLDLMLTELDQINRIVSEFLVLAKPQASKRERLQMADLVQDMMMLLDSEARLYNTKLILNIQPELPEVWGVGSQLKQVILNIMKNAMEAMPDGGELAIEIDAASDGAVALRFIDQGCGIAPEDLKRVGEPFFTRKENGNGLGIMVSQQIIAGHKGSMSFNSAPEQGTCVEIILPALSETAAGQEEQA